VRARQEPASLPISVAACERHRCASRRASCDPEPKFEILNPTAGKPTFIAPTVGGFRQDNFEIAKHSFCGGGRQGHPGLQARNTA
jgi:hypothetical protein